MQSFCLVASCDKVIFICMEKVILDKNGIERITKRIAHEIIEHNENAKEICIIGIHTRGIPFAKRISYYVSEFSSVKVMTGEVDITLYRDDLSEIATQPNINGSDIDFDVTDKIVVLVDDVIYTGRTARAGLEAIISLGRPKCIQLAVLVDRGHRELPIKPNYVGKNIPTSEDEIVRVAFVETDDVEQVWIDKK